MTHTFAATPARSRTLPRASRAPHSKNPLTSTFSEKIQITAAMALLHAGVDTSVIALWLGHEDPGSTQAYLHADMTHQGASPRPHPTTEHQPRPLPATRRPARIPRQPLTPPATPDYADQLNRVTPSDQHLHATVGIIRRSA